MGQPRCAMASASISGRVYALGGQGHKATLRSVEVFDAGSERWFSLDASPMSVERKYLAVSDS